VTITAGVTPIFWVYCVFVIALVVSCAWLLTTPGQPAIPAVPMSPWMPSAGAEADPQENGPAGEDLSNAVREPAADGDPAVRDHADRDAASNDGGAGDGEHSAYA
jgi:hypothetical protein